MYVEYTNAREGLMNELEGFHHVIISVLGEALWNFYDEQIKAIITGSLTSKAVTGMHVILNGAEKLSWAGGHIEKDGMVYQVDVSTQEEKSDSDDFSSLIHFTFPISYFDKDTGSTYVLGKATLYSHYSIVHNKLKTSFLLILVNACVKTIAIWIFFLWAGFLYLSRPLRALTLATHELSEGGGSKAKVKLPENPKEETELDVLAHSFNVMVDKLTKAHVLILKTQERLECIINAMPSAVICLDGQGNVTDWNSYAESMSHIPRGYALGKHITQTNDIFSKHLELIQLALNSNETKKKLKFTEQIEGKKHYFNLVIYPILTNQHDGVVIRIDDITAQVAMEDSISQAAKMTSIGSLAMGVAHEINNPLGSIVQSGQNVIRRLDPELPKNKQTAEKYQIDLLTYQEYLKERKVIDFIDNMLKEGERASEVVSNLLAYTSIGEISVSPGKLSDIMDKAIILTAADHHLSHYLSFSDIKIKKEYDPGMPDLYCSIKDIEKSLIHILKNAAYAVRNNDEKKIDIHVTYENGNFIAEIKDNGEGIPQDNLNNIFEPFFSLKEVGHGAGLGLAIAHTIIVENHKGEIFVDSIPGEHTTFTIILPNSAKNEMLTDTSNEHHSRGSKHQRDQT